MSQTIYLYKYHFPELTSKVYIGQTIDPKRRKSEHINDAKNGSELAVHRAMRKYGIENAVFEVISTCLKEEYADEVEIALIKQYDSFGENGYNMTPGGGGTGIGKSPSEETLKKMSAAQSGENHPLFGRIGKDNPKSQIWRLCFKDGRIQIIDNLKQWCKQNGYHANCVYTVRLGKQKRHKDIIKVEKLS